MKIIKQFEFLAADMCHWVTLVAWRYVDLVILIDKDLSFNLWISIFCLSMLLSLRNNVQVLKIVALVQDSNLIIGNVHGFLMLYAS